MERQILCYKTPITWQMIHETCQVFQNLASKGCDEVMRVADLAILKRNFRDEFLSLLEWHQEQTDKVKKDAIHRGILTRCKFVQEYYGDEVFESVMASVQEHLKTEKEKTFLKIS